MYAFDFYLLQITAFQTHLYWICLTSCLTYVTTVIPLILGNTEESQVHPLKTFLQPCDTVYTQVHCDDDDEDYAEEVDEECAPIKTDDCDRSLQLYCHSDLCLPNCHPILEEYDEVRGKCFRKIGANCTKSEECDLNAVCDRTRHCRCAKNYTLELQSGKCVRSAEFGEFCDSQVICDMMGDVVCGINNTCECRHPEVQFFHPKRKRCYLHLGEDCRNKPGSFQFCPDNSDCVRIQDGKTEQYIGIPGYDQDGEGYIANFSCSCRDGHAPNRDGTACLGIYGTPCNSLHKCNTERSFKCYNSLGQCQCARPKDQIYDEKLQRCVTLIGSLCEDQDGNASSCLIRAICRQDADKRVKVCECGPGFSMGSLDKDVCLKNHGQNCSTSTQINAGGDEDQPPCNGLIGLDCSDHTRTCQCKDVNQFYDIKLKNCRDFEVPPRRIPITHYDTSDREYLFHYKNSSGELRFILIHFIILCMIHSLT